MVFLIKLVAREASPVRGLACYGAFLVLLGGFLKASWKLIWVTTAVNHQWMSDGLFWCLGPGFILLAGTGITLLKTGKGATPGVGARLVPISLAVLAVAIAASGLASSKAVMLGSTVLGNLVLMISLIMISSRRRQYAASALLIVNVLLTFTLTGLARIPEQTAALQWVEEIMNLGAQGCYMAAVIIMWRRPQIETQE